MSKLFKYELSRIRDFILQQKPRKVMGVSVIERDKTERDKTESDKTILII